MESYQKIAIWNEETGWSPQTLKADCFKSFDPTDTLEIEDIESQLQEKTVKFWQYATVLGTSEVEGVSRITLEISDVHWTNDLLVYIECNSSAVPKYKLGFQYDLGWTSHDVLLCNDGKTALRLMMTILQALDPILCDPTAILSDLHMELNTLLEKE